TVDDKARYSAYKVTEVKIDKPKALVLVDCMVNWSDHEAENKTSVVEKVYGMMVGLNGDHAAKSAASVSDAAAEFAMMGISPQGDPRVDNDLGSLDSKPNAGLWVQFHEHHDLYRQSEHHMHCKEPNLSSKDQA
nr:hypothetical protein [Tanacetum cinerariifolium]